MSSRIVLGESLADILRVEQERMRNDLWHLLGLTMINEIIWVAGWSALESRAYVKRVAIQEALKCQT